jgi:hypothetical protein
MALICASMSHSVELSPDRIRSWFCWIIPIGSQKKTMHFHLMAMIRYKSRVELDGPQSGLVRPV